MNGREGTRRSQDDEDWRETCQDSIPTCSKNVAAVDKKGDLGKNHDPHIAVPESYCSASLRSNSTSSSSSSSGTCNTDDRKFVPIVLSKTTPRILIAKEGGNFRGASSSSSRVVDKDTGDNEEDKLLVTSPTTTTLNSPSDEKSIISSATGTTPSMPTGTRIHLDPQFTVSSLKSLDLLREDEAQHLTSSTTPDNNTLSADYLVPRWNAFAVSDPQTQMTVKSIASLGLGSSDGRNLYVRRVPSSASILINNKGPLRRSPEDDNVSEVSSIISSTDSGYRFRRQHWKSKAQFILACVGFTVGFGNVWRFPYLAFRSGAFLIPYFATLFLCAMPLMYMELAVGQFTRRGPVGALGKICPLFKGAGVASLVISFIMSTYSVVIIAWALYYFVMSFNADLPWHGCSNDWNTPSCWDPFNVTANDTAPNAAFRNRSSFTQEFYDGKVLQRSSGIEEPGYLRNELVLCLFTAWIMVYFALWKSVRSSGKVVYLTTTFAYVLLVAFLIFSLTLPGAAEGLRYFFKPQWEQLLNAKVWVNAAAQNFNSIGLAMGSIMTFSSYNKFHNNILTDTIAITLTNAATSLLVGITVFAMLGNIASEQRMPVHDVVTDGPGLVFVVYPQVLVKLPMPNLWAVLFFSMLLCVALNNEFAMVEVVITSIRDGFPRFIHKYFKKHEVLVLVVCTLSFALGLPHVMQGGIYIFQLVDDYAAKFSVMYLAFFETIAVIWIYGVPRLSKNIQEMTGQQPSPYFVFCWKFAAPALILVVWIFSFIDYEPPTYDNGKYKYPWWAEVFGWVLASTSLVTIPVCAMLKIRKAQGSTLLEKIKSSSQTTIEECPLCKFTRTCTHDINSADVDSEWNLHRSPILTTNVTPVIMSETVFEKVSTL